MSEVQTSVTIKGRRPGTQPAAGLPAWASALTVEVALYGVLLLAAAVTRFYALGRQPMQPDEAQLALATWRFAGGQGASMAGYSPPLFWGTVLTFFVLGANDLTARIVPALCGIALVALPYFLRRQLGRLGALAAAGLLLISPSFLVASRTLWPDTLVALASLVLVAAGAGFLMETRDQGSGTGSSSYGLGSMFWVSLFLGIGLIAGRDVYTLILAGLIFLGLMALTARARVASGRGSAEPRLWGELGAAAVSLRRDRRQLNQAGALLAAVFLLGSTGFFLHLGGVQASLDQLAAWLAAFAPADTGYPWSYLLQTLVFYEPLALVFGLAGVGYFVARREAFAGFLTCWLAVAFVVHTLPGGRGPAGVVAVVLPLTLLAGLTLDRLSQGALEERLPDAPARALSAKAAKATGKRGGASPGQALLAVGLALVLLTYSVLGLAFYLDSGRTDLLVSSALALGGAVVVVVATGAAWGPRVGLRAAAAVGGIVLLIMTVHMAVQPAYLASSAPAEMLIPTSTAPDVRNMVKVAEELSRERLRDPHRLPVTVERSLEPLLGWYLRDFVELKPVLAVRPGFVSSAGLQPDTPLVIVPATGEPVLAVRPGYAALPGYVGQRFRLSTWWRPEGLSGRALGRWLFYREPAVPPTPQDVILYVQR